MVLKLHRSTGAGGGAGTPGADGDPGYAPYLSDDTLYSTTAESATTLKTFRMVLDGSLPTKYRAVLSVYVDAGSTGDAQVTITDGAANVATIAFDTFTNDTEAIITGEVAIDAGHSLGEFLTVDVDIWRTAGAGSIYLKYTDFYLVA